MSKSGLASLLLLAVLLGVIVNDSATHFDRELIQLKQQHKSPQKNWNVFYGQNYVFNHSSIKYEQDVLALKKIVEPKRVVLSDISTSYYLAAELPVYVKNIQRHQGARANLEWGKVLKSLCYLDQENHAQLFADFVRDYRQSLDSEPFYLVVNKDQVNSNMRNDCLSQRRTAFIQNIDKYASQVFDGQYLRLYMIKS